MVDDAYALKDRRNRARRPVQLAVWADPGGILPVIDCKVIDISEDGAQVVPLRGKELPDAFALQVDSSRIVGEAHVVWRGDHSVGVKFVSRVQE